MASDIDCVVIGEGSEAELVATLHSLSEVEYYRGKVHTYYVGSPKSRAVVERFSEVTFVEDPSHGKNRAKARNVGWDAGSSPFVQFIEVGDQLTPDWFQRATKEVLSGVAAVCGGIEPTNPDVNRWHRIAYLESKVALEEGRLLDVEPLLHREVLEELGGFNESLPQGGGLEFNARLASTGRHTLHLNFPMARRTLDIPNWKEYWKRGVHSGYQIAAAASKRKGSTLAKEPVIRGGSVVLLAIVTILALFSSALALLLLLPAVLLLLWPRIFIAERMMKQEGLSSKDAALYTWHRSFVVIPQLWGMIRFTLRRIFD